MKEEFINYLKTAKKVSIITGAGVSAESGVPTFRGKDGLWKNYRAEDLATPYAFERDPKTVWEWYNWRRGLISKCEPNPAHKFLNKLEQEKDDFLLITQNVDGLHQKAGNKKVVEIHGSIWKIKCSNCAYKEENFEVPLNYPPLCPKCNNLLRPAVVWFGESLDYKDLQISVNFINTSDLLVVIGTSGVVQPVASFPFNAKQNNPNIKIIEINPDKTPISDIADLFIKSKAGEFLESFI